MRKIKVMHILLSLEYGGAEKVAVNLIRQLQGGRFGFSICVLDRIGALKDELNGDTKVTCMDRKNGLDIALPMRLANVIRQDKPDVIHMHNPSTLLYGAIAGKLAGVPHMMVTQHGSVSMASRKMQFATRQLSKAMDKNIAVSADIELCLRDRCNIDKDKVEIIINGIDGNVYRPDEVKKAWMRKKFGLDDKIVIGHVARLSAEKDQANLLRAFSKVAKEVANGRLVIVGDGPLRGDLESLAKELNIPDKVIFTGFQSDIPVILNMLDIFVLSSVREGTSLTLIEAMAVGLPIVATNVGGNPKVVSDKKTGLLVPPRDPDRLASAIITLCRDPKLREEFGSAGRKRMTENFSLDRMARRYAKLYTELANR